MASTYTPIATQTLGSSTSSITFTSIPSTYTDLVMVSNIGTVGGNITSGIQFNGDTATNYSFTALYGDGSSAGSGRVPNNTSIYVNYYAEATTTLLAQTVIYHIQNYANTNTYKTVLTRASSAPSGVSAVVGLWRSTAAITSLVLRSTSANNYAAGSTFTLYGIKAA
jgi:hypothetical protein